MAKDEPKVQPEVIVEEAPKEQPEEPKEEAPQPEPEQLEEEQVEPQEELSEVEEGEESAPPQMSKRKAERLAKLENLVSKLKGDETPATPSEPKGMDYGTELNADEETIARLEADRKAAASSSFNEGLERAKSIQFHTRLEIDAPRVEGKYSIFDKSSPDWRPETVDAINRWYLTSVGYDPKTDTVVNNQVRYADFVEGVMELADSMAGAKVETTQKNLAKQAANTGLRPDGSTAKLNLNKAPEDMSDDELNAVINRSLKIK